MGLDEIRRIKENAKKPKEKKVYTIPKKSAKRIAQEKESKISHPVSSPNAELTRWFQDRQKEMKGICSHCGGKTLKTDSIYYRFSVAHILPKKLFKSVKTHPLNWIELCHFGNSCHTNFDNHMIDITDLNCFNEVIEKFVAIYPNIDPKERKYIPQALLQYVEAEGIDTIKK